MSIVHADYLILYIQSILWVCISIYIFFVTSRSQGPAIGWLSYIWLLVYYRVDPISKPIFFSLNEKVYKMYRIYWPSWLFSRFFFFFAFYSAQRCIVIGQFIIYQVHFLSSHIPVIYRVWPSCFVCNDIWI